MSFTFNCGHYRIRNYQNFVCFTHTHTTMHTCTQAHLHYRKIFQVRILRTNTSMNIDACVDPNVCRYILLKRNALHWNIHLLPCDSEKICVFGVVDWL